MMKALCYVNRVTSLKPLRVKDRAVERIMFSNNLIDPREYGPAPVSMANIYGTFKKYSRTLGMLYKNKVAWQKSAAWIDQIYYPYMCDSKLLTFDEWKEVTDLRFSPGWPWNMDFSARSEALEDEDVLNYVLEFNDRLVDDESPITFWTIFGKEEVLPARKVLANSCRVIFGASLEFGCSLGMMSYSMNKKLYGSSLKVPSVVGASEWRSGWHSWMSKLSKFSGGFDGDLKAQDASTRKPWFDDLVTFRFSCLRREFRTEQNFKRLLTLYDMIVNSVVVMPDGAVYQMASGNGSGQPNTTTDNTINLTRLLCYCFIRARPRADYGVAAFLSALALLLYGDDFNMTVHKEVIGWFNIESVIRYSLELEIIVTTNSLLPRLFSQLEFLSALTVKRMGIYVSYRSYAKAYASLLYNGVKNGGPTSSLQRVTNMHMIYYSNQHVRRLCVILRKELISTYDTELAGLETWETVKRSWKSDRYMSSLLTGAE